MAWHRRISKPHFACRTALVGVSIFSHLLCRASSATSTIFMIFLQVIQRANALSSSSPKGATQRPLFKRLELVFKFVSRCFCFLSSPSSDFSVADDRHPDNNLIKMRFTLIQGARTQTNHIPKRRRDSSQPAASYNIIVHFRRSFSRSTIGASKTSSGAFKGRSTPRQAPPTPIKSRLKPAKAQGLFCGSP